MMHPNSSRSRRKKTTFSSTGPTHLAFPFTYVYFAFAASMSMKITCTDLSSFLRELSQSVAKRWLAIVVFAFVKDHLNPLSKDRLVFDAKSGHRTEKIKRGSGEMQQAWKVERQSAGAWSSSSPSWLLMIGWWWNWWLISYSDGELMGWWVDGSIDGQIHRWLVNDDKVWALVDGYWWMAMDGGS